MNQRLSTDRRVGETVDVRPTPRGRKRDPSRDAAILEAALDVLAEVGASGITMDLVAERAGAGKGTIYRRWPSKAELIVDAVAYLVRNQVDVEHLPDTGSLRGDLLGLFKPDAMVESTRLLNVMRAFASLLADDHALADAGSAAIVGPWADAHLLFMQRAVARGEVSASADIGTVSQILPSMAAYRTLIQQKPFTEEFMLSIMDGVIMPALGIYAAIAPTKSTGV